MAADESEEKRSFKVEDRRRFSETGEARPDVAEERKDEEKGVGQGASAQDAETAKAPPQAEDQGPEISFAGFVIGLSTQALALLGEIQHPEERTTKVDLTGAQQIIDILGMLQEKTRGNLDESEVALLESVLYDLRMMYVQRRRRS